MQVICFPCECQLIQAEATVRDNPDTGCLYLFSAFVALYAQMYWEEAKPGTDAEEEPCGLKTCIFASLGLPRHNTC